MTSIFDFSTPAKRFRFFAFFEALTWAALIIAMILKRVLDNDEIIFWPGLIHGVIGFLGFIIVALLSAKPLGWNLKVTLLALVSSVPPFGTLVFEWWARRNGLLGELSTTPNARAAAA